MRRFFSLTIVFVAVMLFVDSAFAEEAANVASGSDLGKLAAGFGVALAAFGGALGQSKIAASALEGIGRNPGAAGSMFTPMLLGLVFVETLVLFTFAMAFLVK